LKAVDRLAYVRRYEERLDKFGYSPLTLGWGKPGREAVRFGVLAEPMFECNATSVLDVGCGFADFYEYLAQSGWRGEYQGIDIVPGLLDVARKRNPSLQVIEADIADFHSGDSLQFDAVVASGIFNWKLDGDDNLAHIERTVRRMFELARKTVCVDFMSTHVDFQQPSAWHTDPRWAIQMAHGLTKRFRIRHDYMPFEFAAILYRDDAHPGNVFGPHSVNTPESE
jgi:SAM-dependent methyltransferase